MSETSATHDNDVICAKSLTRRFGAKAALDAVDLKIPRGRVFGLVGENGAGKTTFIKTVLGLLKPSSGTIAVFGRNPVADPEGVLSRLGYLSEERDLPGWMRIRELVRYTRAFYPNWDDAYAEQLRQRFGLDPAAKVKTLSRGQRAQAGLLIALAYRPELLLLDEPSSGLDPIVRRDILEAIIRTVADEGRTVVFSSHLLDEVQRVADDVAMIHEGRIVLHAPLDEIQASHHRITVRAPGAAFQPEAIAGVLACDRTGEEYTIVCNGQLDAVRAVLEAAGASVVETSTPSLEDIFVARVAHGRAIAAARG